MSISLVVMIATAKRTNLLERTLASLGECEKPSNYLETVVIENGSKTGAEKIVNTAPARLRARYLFEANGNKSAALNRGLQEVGDRLVFFTDDDARLHPLTLMAYASAAGDKAGGEFYGGPVDVDYEHEPPEWLKSYLPPSARGWKPRGDAKSVVRPDFLGFNWAAFSSDLRAAGGFDTNRGPGSPSKSVGQEKEMQLRLLKRGLRAINVPQAMVWHYVPKDRCSVEWALKRAYQNGIQAGIEQSSVGPNSGAPRLFGYPRWLVKDWISKAIKAVTKSMYKDSVSRFDASYHLRYATGFLQGIRLAQKTLESKSAFHSFS